MTKDVTQLIVGLDIGTSKVVTAIAEISHDRKYEVIGLGQSNSCGLKKGVVINIDATVKSIQCALEKAELMAECKILHVYASVSGNHVYSFNSSGMVAIKNKEVSFTDITRVIETAKAVNISADQQLLHTIPQKFIVDNQDNVREPTGMRGIRLEVKVHIVTGALHAIQNIIKCISLCGLEVTNLVLQSIASADSVLTQDECELGVILIDIGGGTTDIAIFTDGAVRYTTIIPIAGDQITNDIAMALCISISEAEEIKLRYGVAKKILVDSIEKFEVQGLSKRNSRLLLRQALAAIIEPRIEELFVLIHRKICESGYEKMVSSGIVLTGGSSMMPGMLQLAEDIFLKPARLGIPEYNGQLADVISSPVYATVLGLLCQATKTHYLYKYTEVHKLSNAIKALWKRVKGWCLSNF